MQSLLTDNLCGDLALRLVGNCILIIEHRSVRKIFENTRNDILCVFSAEGRAGNDLCKITDLTVGIDCRKKLFFFYRINLVDDENHRNSNLLQLLGNVALSRTYERGRLHQPHNGIYFLQGSLRNLYHVFSKLVFCLVDTRCVQKYDLSLITGIHGLYLVSGCLWLV